MFFKFNVSELFQLRKFLDSIFLFFPIIYSNHFNNSNSKKNIPTDVAKQRICNLNNLDSFVASAVKIYFFASFVDKICF